MEIVMKTTIWSRTAARVYAGGDFASFATKPEISPEDLEVCGDRLFHFLMVELSTGEGCDTKEEALRRCESARRDLSPVIAAITATAGDKDDDTSVAVQNPPESAEPEFFVAVYEHRRGTDVSVFTSQDKAYGWRKSLASDYWEAEFDGPRPPDDEIGDAYFERISDEYFSVHTCTLV
jgi:hypothetical protein